MAAPRRHERRATVEAVEVLGSGIGTGVSVSFVGNGFHVRARLSLELAKELRARLGEVIADQEERTNRKAKHELDPAHEADNGE